MALQRKPGQGSEKRLRDVVVQYRTTATRAAALQEAAAARGLSLAAYLREREEGSSGPRSRRRRLLPEERAVRELMGQIGYIGNNLNQLTRLGNMGDLDGSDLHALDQAWSKVIEAMDACIAVVGRKA